MVGLEQCTSQKLAQSQNKKKKKMSTAFHYPHLYSSIHLLFLTTFTLKEKKKNCIHFQVKQLCSGHGSDGNMTPGWTRSFLPHFPHSDVH